MREWGKVELPATTFALLAREDAFWKLVDQGIVSARQIGRSSTRLEASSFVGRARVGDVELRIDEKVPGTLSALIAGAMPDAFRVLDVSSVATHQGPLSRILCRAFVELVGEYASRGVERRYGQRRSVGTLAGGRLDVIETGRLRARGFTDRIAFRQPALTSRTPLNGVLLAGLLRVEVVATLFDVEEETLRHARSLTHLFAESRDVMTLFADSKLLAEIADNLIATAEERRRPVISLASILLRGSGMEWADPTSGNVPFSWFVDLSGLFESAVRNGLRNRAATRGSFVTNGQDVPGRVFSAIANRYTTNPDLVIANGSDVIVGDAKYKPWTADAASADIYELLVHAASFSARASFLVFPHLEWQHRDLGLSAIGINCQLFAIRPLFLLSDLDRLLDSVEVLGALAA